MTARRVVTLTCDRDDCRQRWVGGDGHSVTQVRAEARNLAGWRSALRMEVLMDFCRWHA